MSQNKSDRSLNTLSDRSDFFLQLAYVHARLPKMSFEDAVDAR